MSQLTVRTVKIDNSYCPEVTGVEYKLWDWGETFINPQTFTFPDELILEVEKVVYDNEYSFGKKDSDGNYLIPTTMTHPIIRLNEDVYVKDAFVTNSEVCIEWGEVIQKLRIYVHDRHLVDRLDVLL